MSPMTTADFPVLANWVMALELEARVAAIKAFSREMEAMRWRALRAGYRAFGRTRPDGRPRRSGRRHRGMPAWSTRHG